MQTVNCAVSAIEAVNEFVFKVILTPEQPVAFVAGQYAQLVLAEQDKRAFSIANTPSDGYIELHIGATPEQSYPWQAIEHLRQHSVVTVEVGLGVAQIQSAADQDIILLAGGTGYSYARSIALQLAQQQHRGQVYLYWGCKERSALYEHQAMLDWAQPANFHYVPVLQQPDSQWQGRTGLVHQAILADFADLSRFHIYSAGRFEMVAVARDDFLRQGARREQLFADAFAWLKS